MNKTGKPGDTVKVVLPTAEYMGVLLEGSEKGVLMLKLASGYNVGFSKRDVVSVNVVKEGVENSEKVDVKFDDEKKNIGMIITGGTIAARLNPRKGGVDWLESPQDLFKFYPEIFEKVNVTKVEVPFMKASEDMDFRDWKKLAKVASKMLNDSNLSGVVITHGTDFLHYTSAALSFFLRNPGKPVVLTYSQRSIDRASSDANLNLQCSSLAAISDIAEVMLVGHATENDDYCFAMPGTKVRKLHTSRRDAFHVVNGKPFAKIFPDRIERISDYHKRTNRNVKIDLSFEEKVALVKFYPGQSPDILDYYSETGYKGIVLEMGGLGHVATRRARNPWTRKLKSVQEKGMVVCAVPQCINGRLNPMVYSNGRELLGTGIIYLGDMLAETALVKLGWVLGHKNWAKSREVVEEKMLKNFSRELNDRLEE